MNVKSQSLQDELDRLKPTTMLFRHLCVEPAEYTVVEFNRRVESEDEVKAEGEEVAEEDVTYERKTAFIRYVGVVYLDEDGPMQAVSRLVQKLDDLLFFGSEDPSKPFEGLLQLAREEGNVLRDREEFFDRFEREREKRNLRIFIPSPASVLSEGDLPPAPTHTFAVSLGAVKWRQLLPCMSMPLVSLREGKPAQALDWKPPEFKHENSKVIGRSAALVYGALQLYDAGGLFILDES